MLGKAFLKPDRVDQVILEMIEAVNANVVIEGARLLHGALRGTAVLWMPPRSKSISTRWTLLSRISFCLRR